MPIAAGESEDARRGHADFDRAILLTPAGGGKGSAIAVVRLCGDGVAKFLEQFFSRSAEPGRCVRGDLSDGQNLIDDVVVVAGADHAWADICLHGGAWVVESTLRLMQREGFRVIDSTMPIAQEAWPESADELEREVLQYLPMARTEAALRLLLHQRQAWRENASSWDANTMLDDQTLWRLLHLPTIAIVGEPNVGKSTLANRLFGQQRSITADVPGTTRDWVGEMADIGGLPAMLIDTPGLRETNDTIERHAIAASAEKIRQADLMILVLDATRPVTATRLEHRNQEMIVINKVDQPPAWDFSRVGGIQLSAQTGQGLHEFQAEIHRRLGVRNIDHARPCWWIDRQRTLLTRALAR